LNESEVFIMKVKELTSKIGDFGTHPRVYIQECDSILGSGAPDTIGKRYGDRSVNSFIAPNRGEIKVFIKPID